MAETELTVRVKNDYDELVKILEGKGYVPTKYVVMSDEYFTMLPEYVIEKATTSSLIASSVLVRRFVGDENKNLVIYKNKNYNKDGKVISEDKIQTEVKDADKMSDILRRSGLVSWASLETELHEFRNYRHSICVQEINGIGTFIEYEENEYHLDMEINEKIACMKKDLEQLGLDLGKDFFVKKLNLVRRQMKKEQEQEQEEELAEI